mgnify:CR=1 FL=1
MVFGKKKAVAAKTAAKTLAPIPGKAFGVSGKQKKADTGKEICSAVRTVFSSVIIDYVPEDQRIEQRKDLVNGSKHKA